MTDFNISGIADLKNGLKKHANLGDVRNIVSRNGSEMQSSAQRYAPVDTGFLKRSIDMKLEDGGYTAVVGSRTDYSVYQEYGTRYQSGTPHIRPAFHKQKGIFSNDMTRVIKR